MLMQCRHIYYCRRHFEHLKHIHEQTSGDRWKTTHPPVYSPFDITVPCVSLWAEYYRLSGKKHFQSQYCFFISFFSLFLERQMFMRRIMKTGETASSSEIISSSNMGEMLIDVTDQFHVVCQDRNWIWFPATSGRCWCEWLGTKQISNLKTLWL